MNLTHAEAQVLTSIEKARLEDTPSTRACLNTSAVRFSDLLVDWSGAFESLAEKGLIELHDDHYVLSESGLPIARNLHAQRPDKYWYYYQKFYQAAHASAAHTRHCERVYGRDLCQEGMVDMNALEEAVAHLALKGGEGLLDFGDLRGLGVVLELEADDVAVEAGLVLCRGQDGGENEDEKGG